MHYEGYFTVPGAGRILQFPRSASGRYWDSISVDWVDNPMLLGNQLTLIPRNGLLEGERGNQLGISYSHTWVRFMSPLGVPCDQPTYALLAAIDLETKQHLCERPIGAAKDSGP